MPVARIACGGILDQKRWKEDQGGREGDGNVPGSGKHCASFDGRVERNGVKSGGTKTGDFKGSIPRRKKQT